MTSILGHSLLYLGAAFSFLALFKHRWQYWFFATSSIFPSISFILLLYAFISSDMSIKNVFLNSSTTLPFIYKVSASWASHEGSILLWTSILGMVNFGYYFFSLRMGRKFLSSYKSVASFAQLLFLLMIVATSNPFDSFSFTPDTGLGLNPMLQDMALSIHPPILYLGNICFAPLFISSIVLLLGYGEKENVFTLNKNLLNIAMFLLTIGIGLGAWWAYRELGWGGYWFFDPVENISIMPWLCGIALYHSFIAYSLNKNNEKSIILLSIVSFLLIIYGTFIVRSGIISSVHSFAFSPVRGAALLSICLVLTALSGAVIIRTNFIGSASQTNFKTYLLNLGNCLWVLALMIIVISLIYPIYCYIFYAQDVVIDVQYFYVILLPIFIPILLLSAITPHTQSIRAILFSLLLLLFSAAITYYLYLKINFNWLSIAVCMCSIFLSLSTIQYYLGKSGYLRKAVTKATISFCLGHLGFSLLALFVTLNVNLAQEIEFIGKVGDQIQQGEKTITLQNIKFSQNDNYYRQIAIFKIEEEGNINILKPENRLYKIENTLSQEVDIFSYLFYDIYAVISRVDKDSTIHASIHFQPFISLIWLSITIMAFGLIFGKKLR
ncbi:MAG: hypothetical protein DGJ47_000567 [Rickettsiaceae bacterium]